MARNPTGSVSQVVVAFTALSHEILRVASQRFDERPFFFPWLRSKFPIRKVSFFLQNNPCHPRQQTLFPRHISTQRTTRRTWSGFLTAETGQVGGDVPVPQTTLTISVPPHSINQKKFPEQFEWTSIKWETCCQNGQLKVH